MYREKALGVSSSVFLYKTVWWVERLKHIIEDLAEARLHYLINGTEMRHNGQPGDLEVLTRKKSCLKNGKLTS